MGLAVGKIRYLFESLGKIQEALPVDTEYISTLVKMVGITLHRAVCFRNLQGRRVQHHSGPDRTVLQAVCDGSESMPVLMALLRTIQEFMV